MTADADSPEQRAVQLKERGNAELSAGRLDEAIRLYSEALELDPTNATLYSNRAAVLLRQQKWAAALKDAELCVENRRGWEKGYARKGCALFGLRRYAEAKAAFEQAQQFQPAAYAEEIQQCERALSAGSGSASSARPSGASGASASRATVVDQLQLLANLLVPVGLLVYVLQLVGVVGPELPAFAWTHRINMVCAAFALLRVHGRPQVNKQYLARIIPDFWFSVLASSFILNFANPFLAGLVGPALRGAFHFSVAAPLVYPQLASASVLATIRGSKTQIEGHLYSLEVMLGFVLLFSLLSPPRDFIVTLIYWNYLRVRYILDSQVRAVFGAIRQKLDGMLLPIPVLGVVYTKVRDFMSKQVDMAQLQQQGGAGARCTIM